ncbi:hypothetical protein BVC80_839g2 [Macleaya cordata]|uniref:Uncharacterized protein n=1 Tax=Macleaya cordata TaxID=56857 RepID=A0A200Q2W1_MACCD|nr:hypothetical protein BVC80_839g2 [Macleaya cordata]
MDGNGLDFAFSRVLNGDERRLMLQLVGDIEKAIPLEQGEDEISFAVWNYFVRSVGLKWVQSNDIAGVMQAWDDCALRGKAKIA